MVEDSFPHFPLAELHAHLGASIHPAIYWQIAHDQGFKLNQRDYHDFKSFVRLTPQNKRTLNEYFDEVYHPILDPLSSGTHAVEQATYAIMGGAYRSNNTTLIELRNNPMKHNHGGTIDLDHVIMAMLRGMERALLEYPKLSAGLIFILAREFPIEKNAVIIEKAIKYKNRGVIGIDFAGPATQTFHYKDYVDLVKRARSVGLKVTAHSGEVREANDMWECIESISPDRIGHGIHAAYDKELMNELVKRDIVLEVCPLSNIMTKAVEHDDELRFILRTLLENKVKLTINTDWPEMIEKAHLKRQFQYLLEKHILTQEELEECNRIAFESSFIPGKGLEAYL